MLNITYASVPWAMTYRLKVYPAHWRTPQRMPNSNSLLDLQRTALIEGIVNLYL